MSLAGGRKRAGGRAERVVDGFRGETRAGAGPRSRVSINNYYPLGGGEARLGRPSPPAPVRAAVPANESTGRDRNHRARRRRRRQISAGTSPIPLPHTNGYRRAACSPAPTPCVPRKPLRSPQQLGTGVSISPRPRRPRRLFGFRPDTRRTPTCCPAPAARPAGLIAARPAGLIAAPPPKTIFR